MKERKSKDPFCDPKNIALQIYYETKYTYILYNLYPVVKGHTLIVPKRHVENINELTDAEAVDLIKAMRYVIPKLLKIYKADDSYNIVAQIGKYSGRSIKHLHIHIIPRNRYDIYSDYNDKLYKDLRKFELKNIASHVIQPEVKKLRRIFKYTPKTPK